MTPAQHLALLERDRLALLAKMEAERALEVSAAHRWEQKPRVSWAEIDDVAFEHRHASRAVPHRPMLRARSH